MHEHHHEENEELSRSITIFQLIAGAIIFAVAFYFNKTSIGPSFLSVLLFATAYIVLSCRVYIEAVKSIIEGDIFNESMLMAIASAGALCIQEYAEACAVVWLYLLGEMLQDIAVDKSRDSISKLSSLIPDEVSVKTTEGIQKVHSHEIKIGDIILLNPGDRIPVDGVLLKESATFDTSALTGESMPRDFRQGEEIRGGYICTSEPVEIKVIREYSQSTIARIQELIEGAESKKTRTEKFITKFARIYTPAVVCAAILIAVIPSLITSEWSTWIYRALTFLVASCPCALVISIPLAFFAGIGAASKNKILVKGSEYLETLSKIDTMVFDKTGTITTGEIVPAIVMPTGDRQELIDIACNAESRSTHPIAIAITSLTYNKRTVTDITELSGKGIKCKIDGVPCYAGNVKLMKEIGIDVTQTIHTTVYVVKRKELLGYIELTDKIKSNAADIMDNLTQQGVTNKIMLSGDIKEVADTVAKVTGMNEYKAGLEPEEKVAEMEEILKDHKAAYVGDGLNDAAVLARADVGIAMGTLGSDISVEAADIILADDNLSSLPKALSISKRTVQTAKSNIFIAIGIKLIVLALAVAGVPNMMWAAVFADTGVAMLCILNSLTVMGYGKRLSKQK